MNLDSNEIIQSRLWVGGSVQPKDVVLLARSFITTVISLQTDKDISGCGIQLGKLLDAYKEVGIELKRLPVPDFDTSMLADSLPRCVDELEGTLRPAWSRVYLHCSAGVNRAPTVAAAYLIRCRKMAAREAYDFIVSRRYCRPYLEILEGYHKSLF
jgi:hypothetical protein